MRNLLFVILLGTLAACVSNDRNIATVTAATEIGTEAMQIQSIVTEGDDYRIGGTDLLSVSVFQVPDLSFAALRVDASGNIQMPLIGAVRAAGRTPNELSEDIRARLADRYLRNPQVTVTVTEAASQKVTVDGDVAAPGVFEMRGRTTLVQAIAMAKGPTPTADLNSVAIFRTQGGQRMVAVFDLAAIRNGTAEDPVILGDDVIVVDRSRVNAFFRDVLGAVPVLGVFRGF
ncbi:polysaccharide biosynthesis/export family protein [Brevundimonas sp.]|uniref:polysaccharide biosynthesis/export family protein n=1 Tax=Brevundimonas sp. TaxID=1871086 RepID=UPI002ABB3973|nr:polysaccharide biosynthesis/export family protein [Brevundimonas sp.]MDZ4363655.1 polysaccharide biosynthesis/export family protein [Brevundimonas sp.]